MEIPKEVRDYLESLRASGQTNMFGAVPYLMNEFGIDKVTAKEYLMAWLHNQ